jgi:hypothetical protein
VGYRLKGRGSIPGKVKIFSLFYSVQMALGRTESQIQRTEGAVPMRVKRLGREAVQTAVPKLFNDEQPRLRENFETAARRVGVRWEMAASLGVSWSSK